MKWTTMDGSSDAPAQRRAVGVDQGSSQPPAPVRAAIWVAILTVLAGGIYLWAVRGPAIFIDLAGSVATMLCL